MGSSGVGECNENGGKICAFRFSPRVPGSLAAVEGNKLEASPREIEISV